MMEVLQLTPEIEVAHIGPPLEQGHLPAVIYFGLSGQESLATDPYNQPALYLAKHPIRVFSFDLPAHGPNLNAIDAIGVWEKQFNEGIDPFTPFIDQVDFALKELISRRLIVREKIGLMGLSRGCLIASLFAAKSDAIRAMVGFAPMTQLSFAKSLNVENHVENLCDLTLRFYIGNRDIRVGTDKCFDLVQKLSNAAFEKGIRSPPVEMIVGPSIGHQGHGTSKETFVAGADWLGRKLGAIR
ncbi:MAG: hypothetical protein K1000chlam2_00854 [Chlamydiae bacterium]|nr:hypothetical protein [Chlamydiota bacterium]